MLETINQILGLATPFAVLAAGLFFAIFLRGLPFRRAKASIKALIHRNRNGASALRSLALALAGTLGVGNIVGVSSAIALGGFGAIFWMWVSAIAAMFLKYAEVVLALRHRECLPDGTYRGGAPYYIRLCLSRLFTPRIGVIAAIIFAALCLANALMMGCVIQANAVASAAESTFGIPPILCGTLLALLCFALLIRGSRAVTAVTSVLVPLMSIAFLVLSLAILYLRRDAIPEAFANIFRDAFHPQSAGSGILGFLLSRGLRFGTIRGIISNEAGCGTSPTAHAEANTKSPVEQGLFGIVEVFVDTILLCTVTALVVIIHYDGVAHLAADPMSMTLAAYTAPFGAVGASLVTRLLTLAILCFGFATMLCWSHYGHQSLLFIFKEKRKPPCLLFPTCFCSAAILGAVSAPALIWSLTDLVTGIMTLLNTTVLCLSCQQLRSVTFDYFGIKKKGRSRGRSRFSTPRSPTSDRALITSRRP